MVTEGRLSAIPGESFISVDKDGSGLSIVLRFLGNDIFVPSLVSGTSVKIGLSTVSTYVWSAFWKLLIGTKFCSEARSVENFEVCSSEFSLRGMMGFESRILCDGGFLFGVGTRCSVG